MSIITCTAKTQNDLTVARIVLEVIAQSYNYRCSVTYNNGKSMDVLVPDGTEEKVIEQFKHYAPDLDIYKSGKSKLAQSTKESVIKEDEDSESYKKGCEAAQEDLDNDYIQSEYDLQKNGWDDDYIKGYLDTVTNAGY